MPTDTEIICEWIDIEGFPGYQVNSSGEVRSRRKILKHVTNVNGGYHRITLCHPSGLHIQARVSRLVLTAFRGAPPPDKPQASHVDGNVNNNRLDNLAWNDALGNEADKTRHGTRPVGELHPAAKLTNAQTSALLADVRLKQFGTRTIRNSLELAAKYGISKGQVNRIITAAQKTEALAEVIRGIK